MPLITMKNELCEIIKLIVFSMAADCEGLIGYQGRCRDTSVYPAVAYTLHLTLEMMSATDDANAFNSIMSNLQRAVK